MRWASPKFHRAWGAAEYRQKARRDFPDAAVNKTVANFSIYCTLPYVLSFSLSIGVLLMSQRITLVKAIVEGYLVWLQNFSLFKAVERGHLIGNFVCIHYLRRRYENRVPRSGDQISAMMCLIISCDNIEVSACSVNSFYTDGWPSLRINNPVPP